MTLSIKAYIEQVIHRRQADHRIPVLVLTQVGAEQVLRESLHDIDPTDLAKLYVFRDQQPVAHWPDRLRAEIVDTNELSQSDGCLCCSIRSELTAAMSALFLRLLRREEPPVAMAIVITQAQDASALARALKHAPFLGQRYRLLASPDVGLSTQNA